MLAIGVELWTDAIWYTSVGYDDVFWTAALGPGRAVRVRRRPRPARAARQPLARRPAPAARERRRRHAPDADRSAQRGRASGRRTRGGSRGAPWENPTRRPWRGHRRHARRHAGPDPARPRDHRRRRRPRSRSTIAGSIAGNWQTILLWLNRVPYAPAGASPVVDPIFGRDISLLPVRPAVPALPPGDDHRRCWSRRSSSPAPATSSAALAGSRVFSTPVRVHLGVLAGLFLMAIAVGYQLDKFELVYSTRGDRDRRQLHRRSRPVPRLRRPDRPVGDRRGVPRRRRLHPGHVAAGADDRGLVRSPSIGDRPDLPGGRPASSRSSRTSRRSRRRTSATTSR